MNKKFWVLGLMVAVLAAGCGVQSTVTVAAGHGDWLTDFEAAKAKAAASGKLILADFSGSDWCGWCIRLDNEVFSQDGFKQFAQEKLVLLMVDFPKGGNQSAELKKHNERLSEAFGVEGYPTVLLLDSAGKELARTGYQPGGADAYVKHLEQLMAAHAGATAVN